MKGKQYFGINNNKIFNSVIDKTNHSFRGNVKKYKLKDYLNNL